jgi:hypothetical protein
VKTAAFRIGECGRRVCGEGSGADQAIGTRAIFNDNGLFPTLGQPFREHPRWHIEALAGTTRHDDADRSLGPLLCMRQRCRDGKRHHADYCDREQIPLHVRVTPPWNDRKSSCCRVGRNR